MLCSLNLQSNHADLWKQESRKHNVQNFFIQVTHKGKKQPFILPKSYKANLMYHR